MAECTKRYAVVTGANKGLGWGIAKLLASNGVLVVLTARDETRGFHAVEKLKQSGLSELVVFHQLDVTDPSSIASLADFVKTKYGKLDILVNNAGIGGTTVDTKAMASGIPQGTEEEIVKFWSRVLIQTYELAEECISTNYYGAKKTVDALIPLLQLSESPRIVNVSSSMGLLKNLPNEWAKEVFSDIESLTEERIDEVLDKYLEDFREDSLETNNWPTDLSAYTVSKAAMNAHARFLANKYPNLCISCVCPGYVKTDMTNFMGLSTIEEAAVNPVKLALLPNGGPSFIFLMKLKSGSKQVKNICNPCCEK